MATDDLQERTRALLTKGPHYLFSAFWDPSLERRERRLEALAVLYGLPDVLERFDIWIPGERWADRWIKALELAVRDVSPVGSRNELVAIVRALDDAGRGNIEVVAIARAVDDADRGNAEATDRGRKLATTVWKQATQHLGPNAVSDATLRNRRWQPLKEILVQQLVRLADLPLPEALPRKPSSPSVFDELAFSGLLDRLNNELDGFTVLVGGPGEGKSEFLIAYAHWARETPMGQRRYDVVLHLRADHHLALEQEFRAIGRRLDPSRSYEDPVDVLVALQRHDRWLLIVDDCRDPALLLRYLPRRFGGHVVCAVDADVRSGAFHQWEEEELDRRRQEACAPWQVYFAAPLADDDERTQRPGKLGEQLVTTLLAARGLGHIDGAELAALVGENRLALRLAITWLRLYRTDAEPLGGYRDRWARAADGVAAAGRAAGEGGGLATPPLIAAYGLLDDAAGPGRERFDGEADLTSDASPFSLLHRLCSFADHPIPLQVLRHEDADARFDRLEALGLVTRSELPVRGSCFDIHPEVRRAMSIVGAEPTEQRIAVSVAALTVLERSARANPEDRDDLEPVSPRRSMPVALVPHAESLAAEIWSFAPLSAIELRTRAALAHWIHGNPRDAASQVRHIRDIVDRARAQLVDDLSAKREAAWSDVSLSPHGQELLEKVSKLPPGRRLQDVIVLLRRAGFRSGAASVFRYFDGLIDDAARQARGDRARELEAARAAMMFEGALCSRENAKHRETKERLDAATEGSDSEQAQRSALLAVLAQDQGDIREARRLLEGSLAVRREVLCGALAAGTDGREAYAQLARGYFVLARAGYYAGLPSAMSTAAEIAVTCWDRHKDALMVNRATSRSNHALGLALLRREGAVGAAEQAVYEANKTFGADHHDAALVALNQAYVASLLHAPSRDLADVAFRHIIRHWPRRHPLVLGSRLLIAACRIEAGDPPGAIEHLIAAIEDSAPDLAGPSEDIADLPSTRAVAWTLVGNALVDTVPALDGEANLETREPVGHLGGARALSLARDCFQAARRLHAASANRSRYDDDAIPMWSVQADLGLVEVALRLGQPDRSMAEATFRAARDHTRADREVARQILDEADFLTASDVERPDTGLSVTELHALAKLVRSLPPGERGPLADWTEPLATGYWENLLSAGGSGELRLNPRDRMEAALAWRKLALDYYDETASGNKLGEVRAWVERDLAALREDLDDDLHPQVSLRYAAQGDRSRSTTLNARVLREAARTRVYVPRNTRLEQALQRDGGR